MQGLQSKDFRGPKQVRFWDRIWQSAVIAERENDEWHFFDAAYGSPIYRTREPDEELIQQFKVALSLWESSAEGQRTDKRIDSYEV